MMTCLASQSLEECACFYWESSCTMKDCQAAQTVFHEFQLPNNYNHIKCEKMLMLLQDRKLMLLQDRNFKPSLRQQKSLQARYLTE